MEKILIADDEQLMRQLVIDFLKPEGYEILEASDGKEALEIYDKEHPDLILLDVMMPGYDGWTVCREIRRESTVPIMMLTAKGEEIDQLFAYDLGADEYITKPFSPKILVAKIKALLRRSQNEQETHEADDGVAIDRDARQVVLDGKNVDLSPTEYKLLNLPHEQYRQGPEPPPDPQPGMELRLLRRSAHRRHAHQPPAHQARR